MKGMLMAENSSRGAPKPGVRRTTKIRPRALKTEQMCIRDRCRAISGVLRNSAA